MFLKKLTLRNVRSIRELELPFTDSAGRPREWTFLLGENGVGKSTVLKALALLFAGSDALADLIGEPEAWIRIGEDECILHADYSTADGKDRTVEFKIGRGFTIRDVFAKNAKNLDQLDWALQHSRRNYLTIGFGVSRRLSKGPFSARLGDFFKTKRSQSVATLFAPDAELTSLEQWAMDLDYRKSEEGIDIVRAALDDLLPGVTFSGIDKEKRHLMFNTPDGTVPLPMLSDGYQNVAAWCGDLLYRVTDIFEDYKNPLTARGLLLIDEIDLHLHPLWQRQLTGFLSRKLPNFQIVATTHSPMTVHQAREGELFVLRRMQPSAPPSIVPFEGAPCTLLLHQLLLSPIFGLTTLDSREVESERSEHRKLAAKPKSRLSKSEKQRLAALSENLENLPDWSTESEHDRKKRELLEKINTALGG